MVELIAKTPLNDLAQCTVGAVTLRELDLGALTSVAPYKGQSKQAAAAIKATHGITWPAANRATGKEGTRAIWFGREMILLAGPEPVDSLAEVAALADQTDAWACVQVSGVGVEDVLARLVPLDLSPGVFKRGHTARSVIQHMNGSITRIAPQTFLILVFRSMAETLAHDLKKAMASVAARN